MRHIEYLFGVSLVLLASCKQPVVQQRTLSWNKIIILSENRTEITIDHDEDTSTIKYYDYGSFFTGYHKTKIDSMKVSFTQAEKDSIFKVAEGVITNPVDTKGGCTDFVGELKITIDHGQYKEPGWFRQSIEYSGVCLWDTLSTETRQLNKILSRKIKWWHK